MKDDFQVCNECCWDLGLEINSFIMSRCHRKYCDICGYSTDNDLSMIDKKTVKEAQKNKEKK